MILLPKCLWQEGVREWGECVCVRERGGGWGHGEYSPVECGVTL